MNASNMKFSITFAIVLVVVIESLSASHSATSPEHEYCSIDNMEKYCPPCPRACGVNTCGCTCPITKQPILPRSSNSIRPPYCANCPVCLRLPVAKCPNQLPLCTANTIRDMIAL